MGGRKRACSTHDAAFVTYGIDDGIDLIHSTFYGLRDNYDRTVTLSLELVERLTRRFRSEFVRAASVPVVPEPAETAIVDAASQAVHEVGSEADVDLRIELVPALYRAVATLYCEYRTYFDDGVSIELQ